MLIDEEGLSQIPLTSKVIAAETVKDPVSVESIPADSGGLA